MKHHRSTCSCSRRHFLSGAGVTLAGFGLSSVFPTPLIQAATTDTLASQLAPGKRMLFVFLRGGNDGLNAVIPHGDTDYNATNRPTLYIAPNQAIDLNGFASFHPSLADLMPAYIDNELAVIHRIGYPDSSRSHFDGQRIWENGDPSQAQLFEGWLYRYIKSNAVDAGVDLPVVTTQATPPLVTSGQEESYLNIASPTSFAYVAGEPIQSKLKNAWKGAYEGLFGLEAYRPVLSQTGVRLVDSLDEYASWDQANWDPKDPDDGYSLFPVDATTDPENRFNPAAWAWFASLKIAVLALLESDDEPIAEPERGRAIRCDLGDALHQRRARRCTALAEIANARQIEVPDLGVVQHPGCRRAHAGPLGHLLSFEELERLQRVEATFGEHDLPAEGGGEYEAGVHARHVEERRRHVRDVLRGRAGIGRVALGGVAHHAVRAVRHRELGEGDHAAVGLGGALRAPRRPAGEEDRGGVVFFDRVVGQFGIGRVRAEALELGFDLDDGHRRRRGSLEAGEALAIADQQLGFAEFEAVVDFVGRPPAVQRRDDGALAHGRPERDDPLGAVRGHDRDAVSRGNVIALTERPGGRGDQAQVLPVGDPAVAEHQVFLVAVSGAGCEQLPQRPVAVLEDRKGLAEDGFLRDFEGPAGAEELLLNGIESGLHAPSVFPGGTVVGRRRAGAIAGSSIFWPRLAEFGGSRVGSEGPSGLRRRCAGFRSKLAGWREGGVH